MCRESKTRDNTSLSFLFYILSNFSFQFSLQNGSFERVLGNFEFPEVYKSRVLVESGKEKGRKKENERAESIVGR